MKRRLVAPPHPRQALLIFKAMFRVLLLKGIFLEKTSKASHDRLAFFFCPPRSSPL
jgi:hypothetical protein